jgi:CubicO group peptidase (beta-lactamase class C family)
MILRQSAACSYALSGGGEPSGGIGAVPETWTRSPATTARENPATPSYGEWPVTILRSIGAPSIAALDALHQIDAWDAPFASAGVTRATEVVATRGEADRSVRLASVSKPVAALATLVAAEEGVLDLDEPAGPPGSTVRHLLAHASGLPFEGDSPIAVPGRRRIYSNEGFRVLGEHLAARAEMPFAEYVQEAVVEPLGLALDPTGHPGAGMHGSLDDVLAIGRELLAPRLVAPETHEEMVSVQFPGLDGVLPDYGRFSPLDWGLGVEIKDAKAGHWSGGHTSPRTFGHFGGSGTFLWVDPELGVACAALTTSEFGDWAKDAWPRFSDAVVSELA